MTDRRQAGSGATGIRSNDWMLCGVASALLLAIGAGNAEELPATPADPGVQVQGLVADAAHQLELGHLAEARRLCERALELKPGDAAAQHELTEVDSIIAGRATGVVPGQAHPASIELRRQETMTEARVAADQAELLAAEGRNSDAAQRLEPAINALLEIRESLAPEQVQELVRLQELDGRLLEAATEDAKRAAGEARTDALASARGQAHEQQHADRSVYQERFDRVQSIRAHRHLEVALNEARRLMTDYPAEPTAEKLFRDVLQEVHIQRRLDLKESRLELLEALSHSNGINLVVDPQLQTTDQHPVTLKLANAQLSHVFDYITAQMGTTYRLTDETVYLGGKAVQPAETKLYDVSGLIFPLNDNGGKTIAFNAGGGAGGAGANLFKSIPDEKNQTTPEDFVDMMKKAISPETWTNDAYGITIHESTLFVNAPAQVHRLIREYIRSQERQHSLQVRVDTRWLEIDDNYLEEIGVDWGNLANTSLLPAEVSPLIQSQLAPGFAHENGIYGALGTDTNPLPATKVNNTQAIAASGLNISSARLGQSQYSAIFTAVENEGRGHYLAAPSVTTLNGVQSSCFFGTELAYIESYDIVASTLEPKIKVLSFGSSLVIKPFVSADRKYVTMAFRPGRATATLFTELLFAPRIITTGTATFYAGDVPYPIELPNVLVEEAATELTVPDGGTILIGGFGSNIDQQTATRIPFLGNIPFLGRLFGRRGRYSQRLKLYCLANVSIISYDELEATL